ncbi:excalibur calcium-binding domain-containing protein [Isoptericola sp. NEAU-Y5]|uniref:Excalibur calcium-binding domain-containing protein n=1 Tax=Isoptericola luteus TaxID=2879484 RepID=A0ABS7ZC36_9MICO|nr:DUF1524 domain-containing protein [Isoptericola sp. NEAU-Y5]MCA5891861.1 excalibur calcium-binding domain-containing protein [Isoptericola sp. NEAU-Y5]
MTAGPPARRRAFWVGLTGLGLVMLLGASGGWRASLMLALLYVALSAGWGIVTARTWWGRMPRGRAAALGSGALAVVLVVAVAGGATSSDDDSGAVAPERGQVSSEVTGSASTDIEQAEPSPSREPAEEPEVDEADDDPADGTPEAEPGTALAAVALLDVKGRAPKTGYDRDEFGPAWADVDHNGCDTRNDVLRRDLDDITTRAGTHGCIVLTGTFDEPYSGESVDFRRGNTTSSAVQIDHLVALSDAWQKGAQQLSAGERRLLANDPLNLLASDGPLNMSKGDGDAATWLPPNKAFRCTYVARQVAVKVSYDLWVTAAERDAMADVLSACPDEKLPTGDATVAAAALLPDTATTEEPATEPAPTSAPASEPAGAQDASVSYANCTAVRDAGAAPIRRGDPGYSTKLDRDGDGVGCE